MPINCHQAKKETFHKEIERDKHNNNIYDKDKLFIVNSDIEN